MGDQDEGADGQEAGAAEEGTQPPELPEASQPGGCPIVGEKQKDEDIMEEVSKGVLQFVEAKEKTLRKKGNQSG